MGTLSKTFLLLYFVHKAGQSVHQQQNYLNFGGFIQPQQPPPQPQALINPASYIGLAAAQAAQAQKSHQPQIPISSLANAAVAAAHAASKLPLLRTPTLLSSKVRPAFPLLPH